MKLSKKDLRRALQGEEEVLANDGLFPNRFGNAVQALNEGNLEIEGYERSGWTKFDSCKGATYPPKEKFLAWGLPDPDCDGTPTEFFCWRDDGGFSCNESAYPEIHFWRSLPNPPTETEARK